MWLGNLFQGSTGGGGGGAVIPVNDGDAGGYFANLHSTVVHVDFGTANRGFGLAADGVHHFTVLIPNEGYFDAATAGGILSLGFRATLIADELLIGEETLGIDNISLSTKCSDPHAGRLLEHGQEQASQDRQISENDTTTTTHKMMMVDPLGMPPPPVLEPGEDGDDDSYYCASVDFPCEDGKVYVCHYGGPEQGYVTFCIPEPDSEILRFYHRDYCGPCHRNGLSKTS
jgi:hypothetical protein